MNSRILRAVGELLIADLLWGFGFVACIWVLRDISAFSLNALRFGLAFLIPLPWVIWRFRQDPELMKDQARHAIGPGVTLGLMVLLQNWGMEYTTATNSGFLTVLYVLFVPVIERAIYRVHLRKPLVYLIALSLLGSFLISAAWKGHYSFGDLLTVGCAVAGAVHIVWIGRVADRIREPFAFNVFQCVGAAVLAIAFVFIRGEQLPAVVSGQTIAGMFSLVVGSTLLGFFVQVRAQTVLSPVVSSLLFLLEAPFAGLFGFWLLGERLEGLQWFGGALILAAAAGAVFIESRKKTPS